MLMVCSLAMRTQSNVPKFYMLQHLKFVKGLFDLTLHERAIFVHYANRIDSSC